MKKIAVITTTRAEYGLLSPVIKELRKQEKNNLLKIDLVVSGTHLSEKYGMTINEIREQGVRVDHEIFVSVNSMSAQDISNNQAEILIEFTKLFSKEAYNAVILLGDRYETLAEAIAASNTQTPIFHIAGGDVTEGAIDDCIRHSVTKMSYLHFTTNEDSRRRVIQLGEAPERVFNYGSTCIDNAKNILIKTKKEALDSVALKYCDYALCTYHPVTLENSDNLEFKINEFLNAIKNFPDIEFIITKSNADQGGALINYLLDKAAKNITNIHVFSSLGVKRYMSLMKYAEFVLGNSSSGIVETPFFKVPTVNIGDRQRGRLQAKSIINCNSDTKSITEAIKYALSNEMKEKCKNVVSLYGDGNSAMQISKKILEVINSDIDLKKKFYNIEVNI